MADLSVKLGDLTLQNPVMNASGTYGYGEQYEEFVQLDSLGALVTKTITKEPRQGNKPPRICETASGMLNSIGLENIGVQGLIEDHLPRLAASRTKVLVSVGGNSRSEYVEVVQSLEGKKGIDGFELNLSCPNVTKGGLRFGRDPKVAEDVVSSCRKATSLFLSAKLSPHSDVLDVSRACADGGCDALVLINTLPGMAIDLKTRRSLIGAVTGGLSGPAIKPVALHWVFKMASELEIPVIGVGGIMDATDALEFMVAGASAVQIGTANFVDPSAPLSIVRGIETYCTSEGIGKVSSIIGTLHL
jgi:dihydroorotate dehydrogenase (NAD+) catalytic subunit